MATASGRRAVVVDVMRRASGGWPGAVGAALASKAARGRNTAPHRPPYCVNHATPAIEVPEWDQRFRFRSAPLPPRHAPSRPLTAAAAARHCSPPRQPSAPARQPARLTSRPASLATPHPTPHCHGSACHGAPSRIAPFALPPSLPACVPPALQPGRPLLVRHQPWSCQAAGPSAPCTPPGPSLSVTMPVAGSPVPLHPLLGLGTPPFSRPPPPHIDPGFALPLPWPTWATPSKAGAPRPQAPDLPLSAVPVRVSLQLLPPTHEAGHALPRQQPGACPRQHRPRLCHSSDGARPRQRRRQAQAAAPG